jgi:4-amino-4-deoxy-L-arabinose transferase-like glycosyltransferase
VQAGNVVPYTIIFAVAILLDVVLILAWRHLRRRRSQPREKLSAPTPELAEAPPVIAPLTPPDLRHLPIWAAAHWREMAVMLVLAIALVYVWIITPRHVAPLHTTGPVDLPPLAGLGRVWGFLIKHLSTWILVWPIVSLAVMAVLGLVGWRTNRWWQALRASVLFGLFSLALEGELFLLDGRLGIGLILHSLALLGFGAWMVICHPEPLGQSPEGRQMGWLEWALLLLVVALATFARFYALSLIPYGIEGDESKWTVEVVSVMVDGQHTIQSEYHYGTQPLSFYMQAPFHHLLGPSVLSARVAVATYSLVATLVFYWLVRETLGARVALLATVLLSVSIADVSASRLALVEGHVKIWAVASLAFLAHGLRVRRPVHSFLGGVALALGLLTYDTFAPMVVVAVIWAVVSLATRRAPLREWILHLASLLLPVVIVTPGVFEYLMGRMSYYRRGYFGVVASGTPGNNFLRVIQNFWLASGDFLFVRSGPLINALLVPLLALGFVSALSRPRRPGYVLPVLWFVLLFFPVPIYTGHPFLRVFYPGFPAIYVLIALGVLLVWREVTSVFPASFRPGLLILAGLALVGLILLNLFLYFNIMRDPGDRQMRRELADMVNEGVAPGRRVYVPYFADSADATQIEQPLFLLEARRKLARDQVEQHLWMGTYEELLPALSREGIYFEDVAVIVNRFAPTGADVDNLDSLLEALQRCTGARLEKEGRWFSLYVLDGFGLQEARCVAPRVRLEGPFSAGLASDQSLQLRWQMEDATGPAEAVLECQQLHSHVVVIEAEDMKGDAGWHEERRFAPGFRGRSFLASGVGVGSAYVDATLLVSDTYALWVRVYRQAPDLYPFYLSVDGRVNELVYADGDPLAQWTWERVGLLYIGAGAHTVRMARPVQDPAPGAEALFVDTVLLSADPSFDPSVGNEWSFFFESRDDVPDCVSSGAFELGDPAPGIYRCQVTLYNGSRLVDWNGQVGVRSNEIDFVIYPVEGGE